MVQNPVSSSSSSVVVPDELLLCAITHEIMERPMSLDCGHTFDYEAIRMWLRHHDQCPFRCHLHSKCLRPNYRMKQVIERYYHQRKENRTHPPSTPQLREETIRVLCIVAAQGHAVAQFHLAVCYEKGLVGGGLKLDQDEAVRLYHLAAQQGHARAQNKLGQYYEFGTGGVKLNLEEALRWYDLAAQQGLAEAYENLHMCQAVHRLLNKNSQ